MTRIRIIEEIARHPEAQQNLDNQVKLIKSLSADKLTEQSEKLSAAVTAAEGHTGRIINHMSILHGQYMAEVSAGLGSGSVSRDGYANYLVQAWYHTRHTPEFEARFTAKLKEDLEKKARELDGVNQRDNKFSKLLEHGIDEEKGHELWALKDILNLGVREEIDLATDVYPETKALVRTQYDRLERLPFKGFLGYSFYLELFVALAAPELLKGISAVAGNAPEDNAFIWNHHVVDLGHAVDNIELLDFLVTSEEDFEEVIDNMNVIHTLYKAFTLKSFQA